MLTDEQKSELLSELRIEREKKFADRIRIILLLDQGKSATQIAEFFFLDEGTIRNYKKRYLEGGIEKLLNDHYIGRLALLSEKDQALLISELESNVYPTTKSIIDYAEKEFGVLYTVGGMTSLLHRLGFSYKKTKGVPGKANLEKQKKFINQYNGIKTHGLVYFADSTHPMLNPILASGWIKKGTDFTVNTNSGRQRVNINGAIEINSLDVVSRSCETVDKYSVCDLLRAIRQRNPKDIKIYLVLDNASYNRSYLVRDLATRLGIRLLYLPPYSPNLNPIERLWKFVKRKVMANTYYPDIETFRKEIMLFLRNIRKYKSELSTLITDNFQLFNA